ncbi:MAG: sulfurtransferase [Chloroflexi bacterium]|nr:sulfurtransferase [Chloroflexota bacterium]
MKESGRDRLLVSTDWLAGHLKDPGLRIVDLRGLVVTHTDDRGVQQAAYRGARDLYDAGHIPGAMYVDWTQDIVNKEDSVPAQAATAEQLRAFLEARGIGDEHTIIAYCDHPACQFSTRFWWLMNLYGNDHVRVLDGGFARWQREGRTITTEVPRYPPARFTPRPRPYLRVALEEMRNLLSCPAVSILDARDSGQYTGSIRRGAFGGHIPGALNIPREALIDEDRGVFRSEAELARIFASSGVHDSERIVAYCNGGVAATSVLFALALQGVPLERLANYDGSWNEWGNRGDVPHRDGAQP